MDINTFFNDHRYTHWIFMLPLTIKEDTHGRLTLPHTIKEDTHGRLTLPFTTKKTHMADENFF